VILNATTVLLTLMWTNLIPALIICKQWR